MTEINPYYLDYSEQKQLVRSLTERRKILLNLIEEECNEEQRKIYKHMLCEIQVEIKLESRMSSFLKKEWNENDSLATNVENEISNNRRLQIIEELDREDNLITLLGWLSFFCPPLAFFWLPMRMIHSGKLM
jgi:hypothetical protein